LCISSSLPPPASSLLNDIDANGTADVRPSCAWHRFCQSIQVDSSTGSCFQAVICRGANGPPE
jgi:hypothetical protein